MGNATYYDVTKQASNKLVSIPAHDFGELQTNIATFCALLYTLFVEGCDLYCTMHEISKMLGHLFCMQLVSGKYRGLNINYG